MQTKRIARRVLAIVLSLLMIVPSMLTFAAENTNGITYEYIVKQEDPSAAEFTVELYAKAETETKLNALAFGIEWHTALFGYKSISYNPDLTTAASGSGAGIELIDSYNPDNGKLGGTVYPFLDGKKYYFTVPANGKGLLIATITFTLGSAEYYNYYSVDGDKLNAISGANKVVAHDSGDDNGLSVDPADITEISFEWVKNIASVKFFDANNEEITSASQTVEYGGKITNVPENPTKDPDDNYSYTFKGWTTTPDAAAFALVDFNTYTVDSLDVKFYPVFEETERTYTITYVIDGVENTITAKSGEAITAPTIPDKKHYFKAWYDAETGGSELSFPATMTKDLDGKKFWARYTAAQYGFTFDPGKGTFDDPTKDGMKFFTIENYEKVVFPTPNAPEGYEFVGWKYKYGHDGADFDRDAFFADTENIDSVTLIASYTTKKYTVSLTGDTAKVNITSTPELGDIAYGTEVTMTVKAKADADVKSLTVTLNGVAQTLDENGSFTFTVKGETTVNVTVALNEYTVKFMDGESVVKAVTGVKDGQVAVPTAPTKEHYTFDGWYDAEEGGTKLESAGIVITGNATYYARYTPIEYKITYVIDGGTPAEFKGIFGSPVTAPETTKEGYTFDGWYTAADYTGEKVTFPTAMPDTNPTYYGRFVINTYKVTVNGAENATVTAKLKGTDTDVNLDAVPHGSEITITVTANATYKVTDIKVDGVSKTSPFDLTVTDNVTVDVTVAKIKVRVNIHNQEGYTITVKNGEEAVNNGDQVDVGTALTVILTLEKSHNKSDAEIDTSSDCEVTGVSRVGDVITGTIVAPDSNEVLILANRVSLNTYSVTYTGIKDADGTAATDVVKYENAYGTPLARVKIADPANYTVNGKTYTFDKWMPDFDETAPITSNMTFTATYKLASANVSIVYTTVRAADINETTYTAPEGLAVRMDAKAKIFKDGVEVEGVTVTETGSRVTVSADLAAGEYTIVVKKQRYLESTLAITVAEDGTVTAGGDEIAEIALVPGDIVGNGSVEGDGKIDITDFIVGIRGFDPEASVTAQAADIDEDGKVTIEDLGYIKTHYGKTK